MEELETYIVSRQEKHYDGPLDYKDTVKAERADLTPGGDLVFFIGKRATLILARGTWVDVEWQKPA